MVNWLFILSQRNKNDFLVEHPSAQIKTISTWRSCAVRQRDIFSFELLFFQFQAMFGACLKTSETKGSYIVFLLLLVYSYWA